MRGPRHAARRACRPRARGRALSPPALARLVADFIAALDLRDVTLMGNDTGGAICQLVAADHPERIERLVLTNCDAFERFPPPALRPLRWAARVPGAMLGLAQLLRLRAGRRAFMATVAHRAPEPAVLDSFFGPLLEEPGVRRDVAKVLRGISNRHTLRAAASFPAFDRPVLIAWGEQDLFFPLRYAERLAEAFPNGRLERIPGSRTLVPEDRPDPWRSSSPASRADSIAGALFARPAPPSRSRSPPAARAAEGQEASRPNLLRSRA